MFGRKNSQETSNPSAVNQQPQFTKRRQFLFFKIRSKPINAQPMQNRPPAPRRRRIVWVDMYGWLIAIVAAALVGFYMKMSGFSFIIVALAVVAVYLVAFGILINLGAFSRSSRENRRRMAAARAMAKSQEATFRPIVVKDVVLQKQARPKGPAKGPLTTYITTVLNSRKNLESELRGVGIRKSPYDFVKLMMLYAAAVAGIVTITLVVLLNHFGVSLIFAPVLGLAVYMVSFNRFLLFPSQRSRVIGRQVERDIIFAARDVVIGMRSGMPLFNAITSVSSGYGAASKEFGKIIEFVQLGMPIEQAMDEVSTRSESKTFKRLMLQASVSIKAGVDVTSSLQDVVDEVQQERIIDLRRYGQKLNALAMFYMLFGVIFPSMGIAVATIMSTFIKIFPITYVVLVLALVFIAFIQIVLLNIMRNSRPIFAM